MVGTVRVRITGALDGHGIGTGMVGRTFAGATRACIVKTTLDTGRVVVIADSAIAVGPLPIADPDDTLRAFTYRGSMEEHVWADLPASLWRRNVIARSDTTMVMVPAVVHDTTISVATLKVFCTVGDTLTE